MKKILLPLAALIFTFASCSKEATCTCKDSSGNVVSKTSKKSNDKNEINQFKSDCKAKSVDQVNNGVVVASTPCEVS